MIGYVTLGTNDLVRAAAFYDALLGELGAKRLWEFERGIAWGCAKDQPCSGHHEAVRRQAGQSRATAPWLRSASIHARKSTASTRKRSRSAARTKALPACAGTDLCGYFRDLDGNKLNVFFYG